jgi:ubiquinone/menaquinone biosynthesis C-methylase UbiE
MFSNPLKNLKMLHIHETDIVADLGAGTGYYTIEAAHLAAKGKVYAIELTKDYLKAIENKVKELKLGNVECFWGDVEKIGGTKLAAGIIDKAIVSNVFFQVHEKENFIEEVKRILKKGGQVLFIDWEGSSPIPHKERLVPKEKVREMFKKKGFIFERDIDAGIHHYGMIFIKD